MNRTLFFSAFILCIFLVVYSSSSFESNDCLKYDVKTVAVCEPSNLDYCKKICADWKFECIDGEWIGTEKITEDVCIR